MADSQILREYLLAIGFSVNETETKKFDKEVGRLDKGATNLAKTLIGVGAAATSMTALFARSMEQLYYSSRKAESAVGNIQALEYAGKNIGLAGGTMQKSLEGMARAMRANPGLQGLLESLGVQVTGRDKADVLTDFVGQLKSMPHYIAQQYAGLFGIDPDDLLLMQEGLDLMKQLRDERKKMAEDMGVDSEKAAEASREFMNQWRRITEQAGIFRDVVAMSLLPAMKSLADVTGLVLKDWTKIIQTETPESFGSKLLDGLRSMVGVRAGGNGGGVTLTPEARARIAAGAGAGSPQSALPLGTLSPVEPSNFDRLEARYGLPAGFLDRMWKQESNRGRAMLSPKGAQGHFGFMPGTAREMGLKDPNNLEESSEAAARYMSQLLRRYGGDLQKATAAYNWGLGNVDRQGLGKAPWETRQYVQALTGQPLAVEQTNNFYLGEDVSPGAIDGISRSLDTANGNLVRNLSGNLR